MAHNIVAKAMQRQFEWMKTGFAMGKLKFRKREELYDRQNEHFVDSKTKKS